MLQDFAYVQQSLELHLFFARIMKEHSFFLQVSFTPRDSELMEQANSFRMEFDKLLADTIYLSNGNVSESVLESGEVFTPLTMDAEKITSYLTGVNIPIALTEAEQSLNPGNMMKPTHVLVQRVYFLNEIASRLVSELIQFKTMVLSGVNSCDIYTTNYPMLIEHILREAKLYYNMIQKLQTRQDMDLEKEIFEQEYFWNQIMAEHALFIRGLLDPSENELINTANDLAGEFDAINQEAEQAAKDNIPLSQITTESLKATDSIITFKQAGTQGLLECKIKSIIIPLLGDHTLREANHYFRLLNMFSSVEKE